MRKNSIFYSGQRRSDVSNSYLLGNGYRGFNPILKRFTGQDNMSPFDAGGGNGFAYCSGDSINNTDASGHGPLLDFIFIFAGFVGRNVRRASEEMEVAGQAMNRVEGMMDLEVGRNVVSAVATDGSSFTPGDALNAQKGFFEDFLRQQDILVDGWQSNNKFSAFYNSDSRKLKGTIKLVLNKEGGFTARIKLTKRRAYRLSWGGSSGVIFRRPSQTVAKYYLDSTVHKTFINHFERSVRSRFLHALPDYAEASQLFRPRRQGPRIAVENLNLPPAYDTLGLLFDSAPPAYSEV